MLVFLACLCLHYMVITCLPIKIHFTLQIAANTQHVIITNKFEINFQNILWNISPRKFFVKFNIITPTYDQFMDHSYGKFDSWVHQLQTTGCCVPFRESVYTSAHFSCQRTIKATWTTAAAQCFGILSQQHLHEFKAISLRLWLV